MLIFSYTKNECICLFSHIFSGQKFPDGKWRDWGKMLEKIIPNSFRKGIQIYDFYRRWKDVETTKEIALRNLPMHRAYQIAWIQRVVITTPATTINRALNAMDEFFMMCSLQFLLVSERNAPLLHRPTWFSVPLVLTLNKILLPFFLKVIVFFQ